MQAVAHSSGCSMSAEKLSKQTRSHRQSLPASAPGIATSEACSSLLHMCSSLHINQCRFCMCSPHTHWEKAFGKHSSIIEKVLKYSYEKTFLFLISLQHYLYSSLARQKPSTGITPLQEKDQDAWAWNAAQAGACCPPKCCFPSTPAHFPFDTVGRLFS